ncbi:MAG: virginiamycin lyase [Hyphomicrobiales bacterium]|jgi:virginiamycin B lyase|nr:virginiamycin lyase [Hyphomicrobiales bacterium]
MIRRLITSAAVLILAVTAAPAAQVSYYQLPSGSFPHDVAPAPDGTVWFSGQQQGFAGRFDPKTGKLEKIPLGRGAAPHGVIIGPDGAAWLTEGGQNAIARVDPTTKVVKLFPLPAAFPRANLNTLVFDNGGTLWFTGQSGVYGRVAPSSGKVDAWAAPRGSGPYGITATPTGDVWYASLAGDHIAQVDLKSGNATIIEPPRKGVGPRRIWSDSKGMLWASFWNAGGIGRYDPAKKTWTHYPMPQSKSSTYSVYVDDKDRVWATDWIANAIQRFDPVAERYETFPSDKRGASVRQMLGRPGEAWGGESGTDRLVVVRD